MQLTALAKSTRWDELDKAWLAAIDNTLPPTADLLSSLELAVKAKRSTWAEASAWAWLTQVKQKSAPSDALALARELLLRLDTGGEIRTEILELYRRTHTDIPDLEQWIDRSGINGKASVRRALRYLDVGLALRAGAFFVHRAEEDCAEVTEVDVASDIVVLRTPRGSKTMTVNAVIEDYKPAANDDFRVLRQLHPQRIGELAETEPLRLVIGILKGNSGRIDRDALKRLLVPRIVTAEKWSDWWTKLRELIKKSPHITIEGRSPMVLIHHEAGKSLEQETRDGFNKAATPREFLAHIEGYLRECKSRKAVVDQPFLTGLQHTLTEKIGRLTRTDPDTAFALALVVERLGAEAAPGQSTDAHGTAVRMMAQSTHPADLVLSAPDLSIWPLALACCRQALPEQWPEIFAAVLPQAPASQCEALAKAIDETGRGAELLPGVIEKVLADPAEYTEAFMWLWNGPVLKTDLKLPPLMDLLNRILLLVGPARHAGKGTAGLTALRAAVRSGLSAKDYTTFRKCLQGRDEAMGAAVRRQIERAEGLGPVVQDEMQSIVRDLFPRLFAKARVALWDDPNTLYVTEQGRQRKEAELHDLVHVKMRENAIAIGAAAEHGDLSENSEYKFALEERDLLRARLAQMNMEMSLARVLEREELPTDHISIGHRIHLICDATGDKRQMTLLGPWESDPEHGVFAYQTPVARKLLGGVVGATVALADADGKEERQWRVERFEPAL